MSQVDLFRIGVFPSEPDDPEPKLPYVFEDVSGFELGEQSSCAALIGINILTQCDLWIDRRGHCRLSFGFP